MPADKGKPRWRDPTQVNSTRSFVLLSIGTIAGLLLAGYSLFTARSASSLSVPAEDVALVNQQAISRSDYLMLLHTLYGVDLSQATQQQRQKVLNDMIREELFVQRGKELDLASTDPDARAALVNAVEFEIAENAITAQPSEASLRQYYSAHQDRYLSEGVMNVQDWIAGHESGKTKGDEFYFAAKIHLGDQLFAIARDLSDGSSSSPIPTADGVHVVHMLKNKRPVLFDFDKARPQVLNDYRNDAIDRLKAGDESFLRKRANVRIADDLR
jgi:hypothetical protein